VLPVGVNRDGVGEAQVFRLGKTRPQRRALALVLRQRDNGDAGFAARILPVSSVLPSLTTMTGKMFFASRTTRPPSVAWLKTGMTTQMFGGGFSMSVPQINKITPLARTFGQLQRFNLGGDAAVICGATLASP
jgi:hypothetical protein